MRPVTRHLETEPVTDDEDAIAAALEDVSVPALMASVVGITGDPSYIRGPIRPREWVMNEFQGKLTDEEKSELRTEALKAICAWRDSGSPAAAPLSPELVTEIMEWIACEPVPEEYVPLYVEEMDLEGVNPRALPVKAQDPSAAGWSALVIGCGESGLLAALRLQEAGIAFEILEKNDDVGGTWLENRYPGCRVDVASHYYSYSFGPSDEFSQYYAPAPELYRYFRRLLDENGIAEHVHWGCEVERAVWDEAATRWQVTYRDRNGTESHHVGERADFGRRHPQSTLDPRPPGPRPLRWPRLPLRPMG